MNTTVFSEKVTRLKNRNIKTSLDEKEKDLVLSHQDAVAASPDYESVCGEEDPGVALEMLVNKDEHEH